MNPIPLLQVGSQVIAKRVTAVCDTGERGVCYETYELDGRPGWSFIFESGRYDGFSPDEVATFLEVTGAVCQDVADYDFKNVWRLCQDFRRGRFEPAVSRETAPRWRPRRINRRPDLSLHRPA
jgi:hypothetical protein